MNSSIWKILIAAVLLLSVNTSYADEVSTDQAQNPESAEQTQPVLVIDPDIAATEDEEPDCE